VWCAAAERNRFDGENVGALPLIDRKARLAQLMSDVRPPLRVGRIGAFRDDALELQLAGLRVEGRAPAPVIVAVMCAADRRGIRVKLCKPAIVDLGDRIGDVLPVACAGADRTRHARDHLPPFLCS